MGLLEEKVTQADRDNAAGYLSALGDITGREKDMILRGKWDHTIAVKWFTQFRARHALALSKGSEG